MLLQEVQPQDDISSGDICDNGSVMKYVVHVQFPLRLRLVSLLQHLFAVGIVAMCHFRNPLKSRQSSAGQPDTKPLQVVGNQLPAVHNRHTLKVINPLVPIT